MASSGAPVITSPFGNLTPVEDTDATEKIVVAMMDTKDIQLKTELNNPLGVARLQAMARVFEEDGFPITAKVINGFIKDYMEDMVSFKRKGRTEIKEIATELQKQKKVSTWTGQTIDESKK